MNERQRTRGPRTNKTGMSKKTRVLQKCDRAIKDSGKTDVSGIGQNDPNVGHLRVGQVSNPFSRAFRSNGKWPDSIYPNSDCGHRPDAATRRGLKGPRRLAARLKPAGIRQANATKEKPLSAPIGAPSVEKPMEDVGGGESRPAGAAACFAGCEAGGADERRGVGQPRASRF